MYTIDFTKRHYRRRRVWQTVVGGVLLGVVAGAAMYTRSLYEEWSRPVLAQTLREYDPRARQVEKVVESWRSCERDFDGIRPYYRAVWSEGTTNLMEKLATMALPDGVKPVRWKFSRGGDCSLNYEFRLASDLAKSRQCLEVTQFFQHELSNWSVRVTLPRYDLADVWVVPVTLVCRLKPPRLERVPPLPKSLVDAVQTIDERRKTVMKYQLDMEGSPSVASLLQRALGDAMISAPELRNDARADWMDVLSKAISPDLFLDVLEDRLTDAGRPVPDSLRKARAAWNAVGQRQIRRVRQLDDESLQRERKMLGELLNPGFPQMATFDSLEERIETLRRAAATGYTETQVFRDGFSHQALRAIATRFGDALVSRLDFKRLKSASGHSWLAEWELVLNPKVSSGSRNLDLRTVGTIVRHIEDYGVGFVVTSVAISFDVEGRAGRDAVTTVSAVGLLPFSAATNVGWVGGARGLSR